MKVKIKKISTIEDKDIYSIDLNEAVCRDDLDDISELVPLLFDKYYYFEKADDPNYPNRWILFLSRI